ncbi:MAG: M14 family zinc carboxypeptidase [Candidatus Eisenbacteria bacterium]
MRARRLGVRAVVFAAVIGITFFGALPAGAADPAVPPGPSFEPGADLDPSVPDPAAALGATVGTRPASGAEIARAFEAIAAASPRVLLQTYGRSHEGRPLLVAIVSSPTNLERREEIRGRLASFDGGGAESFRDLPAVVWIGASVHGDEASGTDAVLALLHHLAADRSEETRALLERTIVLLDPVQNPDGRNRFLTDVAMWNGRFPDTDPQSIPHRSPWPSPRGNHYFLNLNRDWFALSQPETAARVKLLIGWRPQVTIDLHEMRASGHYLLSPPREPYNPHLPSTTGAWWDRFAGAVARAFGGRGWPCATGDWNEEFNPNRGGSWPLFTGAVAFLGEQSTTDGVSIRRPEGGTMDYRDAVARQFVVAREVLRVAAEGREELLRDFARARREEAKGDGSGTRSFLIPPEPDRDRARRLAATLAAQGVPVRVADKEFTDPRSTGYWGEGPRGGRAFPAGTYVVPLDRPGGRLARAVLDFDPVLDDRFLTEERRLLELGEASLFYESPAWSLAMAFGVDVYESGEGYGDSGRPFEGEGGFEGAVENPDGVFGFLLDAAGPGTAGALVSLLLEGIPCAAVSEPFMIDGRAYGAGTTWIGPSDERVPEALEEIARRTGAIFRGVDHPLSDDGPDLGSRGVRPLFRPRTALLAGPPFYEGTFGALWHWFDVELGLPCALLRAGAVAGSDLEAYDVIVVPDAAPGRGTEILAALGEEGMKALASWTAGGGTLITLGEGNWALFGPPEPLVSIRARRQVLADSGPWLGAAEREAHLGDLRVDGDALRSGREGAVVRGAGSDSVEWAAVTEMEDEWLRRFSPEGVILRADLDGSHWLTGGVGDRVPVLLRTDLALVSRQPARAVGRFAGADRLRLSGLLWPEARERRAHTSYLVREKVGDGQVISFLGNPAYRAYFHGTGRLFTNAVLLGPALGTSPRVDR